MQPIRPSRLIDRPDGRINNEEQAHNKQVRSIFQWVTK